MAVFIPILCPDCHQTYVIKHGRTRQGKQRYRCQNEDCLRQTFILEIEQPGRSREVKQKIVEMALNSSGVRDTARVLRVSPSTVIKELKKNRQALNQSIKISSQPSALLNKRWIC